MKSKILRIAFASFIAGSTFVFKKPIGDSIFMAASAAAQARELSLEDKARAAAAEIINLLTKSSGDRAKFLELFTERNHDNDKFFNAFKAALTTAGVMDQFKAVYEKYYEARGARGVWRKLERRHQLIEGKVERASVPGQAIENPKQLAEIFLRGQPKLHEALQTLGMVGANRQNLGGEYTKQHARERAEQRRIEVIQRIYLDLLKNDEAFRALFDDSATRIRPNGRYDERFQIVVKQLEGYLDHYARASGAEANTFSRALSSANKSVKDFKKDGILDETMATALAIYGMVKGGTWEKSKQAFLAGLQQARRATAAVLAVDIEEAKPEEPVEEEKPVPRVEIVEWPKGLPDYGEFIEEYEEQQGRRGKRKK